MDIEQIRAARNEIVSRLGPWTAHCVWLGGDEYTFASPWMDTRLRRFVQIAADITDKPLDTLRVLDLACLEGWYGIEFALHGAEVLGVDGREANLAKARLAKDALSLDGLELRLDDVRHVNIDSYGSFDVVLCLGILYHLDTPDVFRFVRSVSEVCRRVAIIDTHISLKDTESFVWEGHTYWGRYLEEHRRDAKPDDRLKAVWASLDNPRAFQFTRASLCNLLRHVGFTSVYECHNPYEYHSPLWPSSAAPDKYVVWENRITLVAIKGRPQTLRSSPITDAAAELDRPEKPEYYEPPDGFLPGRPGSLQHRLARVLKRTVKKMLKKYPGR